MLVFNRNHQCYNETKTEVDHRQSFGHMDMEGSDHYFS